jgi:rod shape-determining protein MreD
MRQIKLDQIYASMFVALVLQLLPWSGIGAITHPDFMLLTLIYWLLRAPKLCNIGTAWLLGLVADIATGGVFGQSALAYAFSAYFAVAYHRRLVLFNAWQQTAYVFAILLLTQTTLLVLKLFAGGTSPGWIYFAPCISGIILWQAIMFSRIGADMQANKK